MAAKQHINLSNSVLRHSLFGNSAWSHQFSAGLHTYGAKIFILQRSVALAKNRAKLTRADDSLHRFRASERDGIAQVKNAASQQFHLAVKPDQKKCDLYKAKRPIVAFLQHESSFMAVHKSYGCTNKNRHTTSLTIQNSARSTAG